MAQEVQQITPVTEGEEYGEDGMAIYFYTHMYVRMYISSVMGETYSTRMPTPLPTAGLSTNSTSAPEPTTPVPPQLGTFL